MVVTWCHSFVVFHCMQCSVRWSVSVFQCHHRMWAPHIFVSEPESSFQLENTWSWDRSLPRCQIFLFLWILCGGRALSWSLPQLSASVCLTASMFSLFHVLFYPRFGGRAKLTSSMYPVCWAASSIYLNVRCTAAWKSLSLADSFLPWWRTWQRGVWPWCLRLCLRKILLLTWGSSWQCSMEDLFVCPLKGFQLCRS